jgi:DNA-binding transcriptional MocR family regulator
MPEQDEIRSTQRRRTLEALRTLADALEVAHQRVGREIEALDREGDQTGLASTLEVLQWDIMQPGLGILGKLQSKLAVHCLPEPAAA